MSRHSRPSRITGMLLLAGLSMSACSGPNAPLDIGTQTAALSLVLGQLKAVQDAPVGPVSTPPRPQDFPYYQPPPAGVPPVVPTLPPLPTGPCPAFDPLAPVLGVGRVVAVPPVKATYHYRTQIISSYPGKTSSFSGDALWTIEPGTPDATTGAYDVTYTVKAGSSVTKRVLRTLPHDIGSPPGSDPTDQSNPNAIITTVNGLGILPQPLPADLTNLAAYGLAGIYLVSQESTTAEGKVQAFTPSPPMALLQLRQLTGATDSESRAAEAITSVGYDPTSQAAMAYKSTVLSVTNKVNACGTPLQSVQISLSAANNNETKAPATPVGTDANAAMFAQRDVTSDPTKPKTNVLLFTQKIDFGLQYGGLILQEAAGVAPYNGFQVDNNNPPPVPSSVPSPDPGSIEGAVLGSVLTWAATHMIFNVTGATINEKPKYPKAAA